MTAMSTPVDPIERLAAENPGWKIFRSKRGRLYAANSTVSPAQLRAGCTATVDADTPERLQASMTAQMAQRAAVSV